MPTGCPWWAVPWAPRWLQHRRRAWLGGGFGTTTRGGVGEKGTNGRRCKTKRRSEGGNKCCRTSEGAQKPRIPPGCEPPGRRRQRTLSRHTTRHDHGCHMLGGTGCNCIPRVGGTCPRCPGGTRPAPPHRRQCRRPGGGVRGGGTRGQGQLGNTHQHSWAGRGRGRPRQQRAGGHPV